MPTPRACPVDAVLAAVSSGTVQEPLLDWYVHHFDACDACCDRLEAISRRDYRHRDAARRITTATIESETEREAIRSVLRSVDALAPEHDALSQAPVLQARPPAIGPFRILKQVGVGATAVVYEAVDLELERNVILKVLRSDLVPDDLSREVLMAEARALAAIDHPNVMPLYQVLWHDDVPALVLPSLPGRTLADAIAGGIGDWKKAVRIVRDVADAIQFTHARGITHRDIKPSNIWLRPDAHGTEKPLLFDFGLAGITSSDAGTPGYRPPAGAVNDGDSKAADVFSLAVVLFEVTRACAGTPSRVRGATARLLTAGPADRPTALAMHDEIGRFLDPLLGRRRLITGLGVITAATAVSAIVGTSRTQPSTSPNGDAPLPITTFHASPGTPFAVSEDTSTFCTLDDRAGITIERSGARTTPFATRLPFKATALAVRNDSLGGLIAVAGDDRLVILDPKRSDVVATYDGIGIVTHLAWAGVDDATVVVHAGGDLFTASQKPDGSFPGSLTVAKLWRGWSSANEPISVVASLPRFDYVVVALANSMLLTWSLPEAKTNKLIRLEPAPAFNSSAPTVVGWRSFDGFYVVKGKRVSSLHVLPRMTEEIDLPARVSDCTWLVGDVIAFVAAEGPRAGQLGCIVQSKPANVLWLPQADSGVALIGVARNRTVLVAGCADGRVMLFQSAELATAVAAQRRPPQNPLSGSPGIGASSASSR